MATYIELETEVTLKELLSSVEDGIMALNYHCTVAGGICIQHWTVPTEGADIQIFTKLSAM
jgi:hypothetical protein